MICFLGETFSAYTKTEQYKIRRFQMYTNLKMIFVIFVFFNAYNESHPHPQTPAEGLFKTLLRKIFENNL